MSKKPREQRLEFWEELVQQSDVEETQYDKDWKGSTEFGNYNLALFYFSKDNFSHGVKGVEHRQKPDCCGLSGRRDTSYSETGRKKIKMNADVYHNENMQIWAHGNNTAAG